MKTTRTIVLLVLLGTVGMLLAGCGGRTYLIGRSEQIQIGQEASQEFEQTARVDRTSDRARWLANIGQRVAAAAQPPEYPYEFVLVREDVNNAFAYPGGPIYFYEGLIDSLGADEHQVAWVCGHELTHVRNEHAAKRIESALGAQLLIEWLIGGQTTRNIAGAVTNIAMQKYSRDDEYEADTEGVRWAAAAGYDPTAALAVLATFSELQGQDPSDFEILFYSHPGNTDRTDNVRDYLRDNNLTGRYLGR
ncbi:MAG: M48 family metalloprotease [candidate division WS1 bacterium]|jgi:predicted Zn-dependent protease|nr:M48 family metalloprotease [candidate division WS1 bacterium]